MNRQHEYNYDELRNLFSDALHRIERYRKLPADLLLTKPSEDAWSPSQICRHLIIFGKTYLEQIDRALSKAGPVPQGAGPFRPRWHFRKMADFFDPPYKIKTKTLSMFIPERSNKQEAEQTLDELEDVQANVLNLLDRAEDETWNLRKIKGKNPALRMLSMNMAEYLILMDAHQRRHFWQIEQILQS